MKFTAEHSFVGTTLADFEQVFFDEAFNEALCKHTKLRRTLVSLDRDGPKLARVARIEPERQLPAPLAKIMGTQRLGYVEHLDYTFGSYLCPWRIEPAVLPDKVKSFGTITLSTTADGRVLRRVDGEVNVKIFGLGGTLERIIVADVLKSYDDAAAFTEVHLRTR